MKYAVIDMTTGDSFEDVFDTEKEALDYAQKEFDRLAPQDKKRRTFYAVMSGELNEDECFDLNTAKEIKRYI